MKAIFKSAEGERLVLEHYQAFLKRWPVPNRQVRVPTSQGETFVIISGPENAPALLLLHGGLMNSAMWMGEVTAFARFFRIYCIDMIGEPANGGRPMVEHKPELPTVWPRSSIVYAYAVPPRSRYFVWQNCSRNGHQRQFLGFLTQLPISRAEQAAPEPHFSTRFPVMDPPECEPA